MAESKEPKLLSGGIATALVTTMQGLMVAIPFLLFGNLLNGWAERIKDDMEKAALKVINIHQDVRTGAARSAPATTQASSWWPARTSSGTRLRRVTHCWARLPTRRQCSIASGVTRRTNAGITQRPQRTFERCIETADDHTESDDDPEATWPLRRLAQSRPLPSALRAPGYRGPGRR